MISELGTIPQNDVRIIFWFDALPVFGLTEAIHLIKHFVTFKMTFAMFFYNLQEVYCI